MGATRGTGGVLCLVAVAALLLAGCASAPGGGDVRRPAEAAAERSGVPQPARDRFGRALSLMERGDFEAAEPMLRDLAEHHPTLAGPPANLGIVYTETGRLEQAEQAFRQALERNPDSAAIHNQLGVLYRMKGRFEQARQAYERAIAIDPGYANAHLNLGILLELYLQQPAVALPHYQSYQRLAGEDRQVALWIVDLQRRLQDGGRERAGGER